MTTYANLDLRLEINSVDLSDWATEVSLPIEFDELDDTAFGDTARSRLAGLQDGSVSVNWNVDFAAASNDVTIFPLLGTVTTIKVRPTSSAIGSTNPEYVGSYLVSKWQPFNSSVGQLATTSTQWPLSDSNGVSRNTS